MLANKKNGLKGKLEEREGIINLNIVVLAKDSKCSQSHCHNPFTLGWSETDGAVQGGRRDVTAGQEYSNFSCIVITIFLELIIIRLLRFQL